MKLSPSVIGSFLSVLLVQISSSTVSAQPLGDTGPDRELAQFYNLVSAKQCEKVVAIAPKFTGCETISGILVPPKVLDKIIEGEQAVLHYTTTLLQDGKPKRIEEYIRLDKVSGKWKIDQSQTQNAQETDISFGVYRLQQFSPVDVSNIRPVTEVASTAIEPKVKNAKSSIERPASKSNTVDELKQTIEKLYQAVGRGDCKTARKIRRSYANCESVEKITSVKVHDALGNKNNGVVHFSIGFIRNGKPNKFDGYVRLTQEDSGWVIVPETYISKSKAPNFSAYANRQIALNAIVEPLKPVAPREQPIPAGGKSAIWQNFNPTHFGSAKIFNACFSQQDLRGAPNEKKTRRKGPGAYLIPPNTKRPTRGNAVLSHKFRGSIRRVDTNGRKVIALGFDIGERNNDFAGYDAEIIQYLRKHKIKATLYMGGKWLATHPKRAMQLVADPLFEIGNHAWTHGNFGVLKGKEVDDQIYFTEVQYETFRNKLLNLPCAQQMSAAEKARIPVRIPTFRFPYGTCTRKSLRQVNQAGLPAVQWNVVTADPSRGISAKAIARTILRSRPGSIVVAHANGRGWKTGKALPLAIPKMLRDGWQFVTVSELLTMGRPVIVKECYELKPGDNLRYNRIFGKGTGE